MEKYRKKSETNLTASEMTSSARSNIECEKVKKRKSESSLPEPMFRIGGKTDPDRFSGGSSDNKFFFRVGFHDDERSDTASPKEFYYLGSDTASPKEFYYPDRSAFFDTQRRILMERMVVSATSDLLKLPRPILVTSAPQVLTSTLRTTLSPVKEVVNLVPCTGVSTQAPIKRQCSMDCSKFLIERVC